ncbi:uncharacterized protein M421DRAFT_521 [Didymella exigua CBS 183.55]|uniref:Rhodopsin domain-containing protein n=1 Tax=Didymella exigua CBS 183.55 TaxID=1150837 RepID=A0A6A5S379_9PLEO|nr:uncharacterized protein M421DRAFT_521 [Didymella exigua CBS 183.55]KAF1934393.1 hypothetical protein M421DRAFT_521 [Didymella exigua CBS 183.55]
MHATTASDDGPRTASTGPASATHSTTIHAPLTAVTPQDQTGIIAILAGFSVGLLLLSTAVRVWARRNAGSRNGDDCTFYAGMVIGLGEAGLTLWLIGEGLGKSVEGLDEGVVRTLEQGVLGTTVLYLATLWMSKVSCALMLVGLNPFKHQRRAAWGLVVAATVWFVSCGVVVGTGCRDILGQCHGAWRRWVYISVVDMVLEVALVGASVYMVWGRSMSMRAKGTVVGAFACRLPNVALTLAHLLFLTLPAPTTAIHSSRIHAPTQLAISYTIVSCVIPYLRPLMQSYESDGTGHGGAAATFNLSDRSRDSKGSRDLMGGRDLQTLDKGKAREVKSAGAEVND